MAVASQVGGDATVGSVSPPTALHSAVDLNVSNNTPLNIQALGLGVGLEVLEQLEHVGGGLLGPSALSEFESLSLSMATNATAVLSEGNDLLVLQDGLQVFNRLQEFQALDSASYFVSVLVMSSQVLDLGLGGWGGQTSGGLTFGGLRGFSSVQLLYHLANLSLFINNNGGLII